jgi:hypothetical protein
MSTHVDQSTINTATVDDAPYTSKLLRHDTELKRISTLLTIMRAVLPYASDRTSLLSLIKSTGALHSVALKELEDLLKRAELLIQYEYEQPGRIFESNSTREEVEEGLVALAIITNKLVLKGDELEAVRVRLLQSWAAEAPTA